jgi:eukaryotic-like serine/threonine-protein kinase
MSLVAGSRLGPYEIQSAIGAGGMGEVYKARDTRLDRLVAIKVLPPDVSGDHDSRARFEREAKTIAALNHSHICTLHDVGEHEGATFLVMELLEGEPLRARLSRCRAAVPLTIDLAIQLADALESAHANGVIHRDIKPENIFITTRGAAKLLDFGIAKLATERATATEALTATRVGTGPVALGTLAYMSPEQVRGEALDGRTDLFSLGVVLYELTTGTQPFRGTTSGAVLGEILTKAPTAPVHLNPDVPPELERIVNKLLEKERELRYQSARDVRVDLERLRRTLTTPRPELGAAASEQASILVLPFENLSPDPDNAFFADGLTEEVIADLSKVRSLRVISRTSAMHYKGTTNPLPAIARELNVRHVLEGSVRRAGNNLRITAQLIDAATDAHLWAEKYGGTLDDVFELQERLSRRIVDALRVVLTPAEESALAHHTFDNAAAYDCYLHAAYEATLWTADGLDRAEQYLKRGLAMIGEHPAILAGLAYVLTQRVNMGFAQDETQAQAVSLAERALALDPSSTQAHATRGVQMLVLEGNLPGSLRHLQHAVAAAAADTVSAVWLSWAHLIAGHNGAAASIIRSAVERDPLNPNVLLMRSLVPFLEGRFGDAAALCAVPYEMSPDSSMFVYWYAVTLAYAGRVDDCYAVVAKIAGDPGDDAVLRLAAMTGRALAGDREGMDALVTPSFEATVTRDGQSAWNVAACYAKLGDWVRALFWLENAIRRDFIPVRFLATVDPFLASLRGDPRFETLMDKAREKQRSCEV